jgi:hypothetical protein
MPDMVDVSVTVDDQHLGFAIHDVAAALRANGMDVKQVNEAVGVISGTVADVAVPSLETVPGVKSVERARTYRLPPPDSAVQ